MPDLAELTRQYQAALEQHRSNVESAAWSATDDSAREVLDAYRALETAWLEWLYA